MSLKETVLGNVRRLSEEVVPGILTAVDERVGQLKERIDEINCSLASRALPAARRERVKTLLLEQKAAVASQKRKAMKVVRASRQSITRGRAS
ncbi:hypothetical protein [Marinobacter sp. SS21]|uniref:hypothetical protein n=1 Tax=Marinobacter sp. SS21 TaxID=2979460 RepID=UPI00232B2D68|nr:hypothetical protein [Marinobacter sp. SS21]MDC0663859.1 hypothetical protein [Marinobacter sp. SS21]